MKITYQVTEKLKPPKRQLRTHKPKQVEQIVSAIRRMGFINPLIVDPELNIVCGVGRYLAAREIGLSRLPTIMVGHLTEAELRAYAIADNKLVLNDTWDEKLLTVELSELMVFDVDLPIELTQFDMIEIDALLHVEPEIEDAPPDPFTGEPVSRLGDLFRLGDHRLLCGDSRNEESYQLLLGEERVRCVFSYNPYNIKILGNVSGLGKIKHGEFLMASGELTQAEFTDFLTTVFVELVAYDPEGMEQAQPMMPQVTMSSSPYAAIEGADCIVLITEWDAFRALDLKRVLVRCAATHAVGNRAGWRPVYHLKPSSAGRQRIGTRGGGDLIRFYDVVPGLAGTVNDCLGARRVIDGYCGRNGKGVGHGSGDQRPQGYRQRRQRGNGPQRGAGTGARGGGGIRVRPHRSAAGGRLPRNCRGNRRARAPHRCRSQHR